LTVPLVAPDAPARIEIVRQFATQRDVKLLPAMIKTLGDAIHGTAPELQSAVIELSANAKLEQTEITPMLVRKYLASRTAAEPPSLPTIAAITAKYFQLKVTELRSPSRRRAIVTARGIAIYLARELTGLSLEKVGAAFGGRDHTTILHSFRTTADRLRSDAGLRRTLDDLRRLIALSKS
jgi:chromosomal replication initiator protein